jgi:hypothetical protein
VTSLSVEQATPRRLLALSRGPCGIENRLFHVTDDSFGEDRHVLHTHAAGLTMSLLRAAAVNLLRGDCCLWTAKTPLPARAEWVNGHPPRPSSPPWNNFEKDLSAGQRHGQSWSPRAAERWRPASGVPRRLARTRLRAATPAPPGATANSRTAGWDNPSLHAILDASTRLPWRQRNCQNRHLRASILAGRDAKL